MSNSSAYPASRAGYSGMTFEVYAFFLILLMIVNTFGFHTLFEKTLARDPATSWFVSSPSAFVMAAHTRNLDKDTCLNLVTQMTNSGQKPRGALSCINPQLGKIAVP